MLRRVAIVLLSCASSLCAHRHPSKTAAIDDLCAVVRNEFVESAPHYFAGPDPWVPDQLPDSFADAAVASVYMEGARVRWVVLQMAGPQDGWFETTQYFFDEAGSIKKRERRLELNMANIRIEESLYFQHGRVIKTTYNHGPMRQGPSHSREKENWDSFYDPDAPEYNSTAELPNLFTDIGFERVAVLEELHSSSPRVDLHSE